MHTWLIALVILATGCRSPQTRAASSELDAAHRGSYSGGDDSQVQPPSPPSVPGERAARGDAARSRGAQKSDAPRSLAATQEDLYRRACELGAARACNDLGVLLYGNPQTAKPLFEKACDMGMARACTNLASLLTNAPDARERVGQLLKSACKQGDGLACAGLGNWLFAGGGSHAEAYQAVDRACSLGVASGCEALGWMLLRGLGVAANREAARVHLRSACDREQPRACMGLGVAILEDQPSSAERTTALGLLDQACDKNVGEACYILGTWSVLEDGTIPEGAHRKFERACSLGDERGCKLARLNAVPDEASEEADGFADTPE